ncbi:MAG: DNA modification methylase [Planctomycetia bacterium]|nr:DNA modification methylase [Planctomycetia bacterium]
MLKFTTQEILLKNLDANMGQIPDVPQNPRKISEEDMERLKKSITDDPEFLTLWKPVVFDVNGRFIVLSGNQRLKACQVLKIKSLTCDVLDAATPAEILRKIVIKANRMAGEDDFDLLRIEWDFDELQNMWTFPDLELLYDSQLLAEVEADETLDDLPEIVETRCKSGDVWQLGEHWLMCGDATLTENVNRLMNRTYADLLVTDPPYNVDYEGGTGLKIANDKMGDTQFLEFLTSAFRNASNVLKPGGVFYIWHADSEGLRFRTAVQNVGLKVRQCLIWNKNTFVLGRQDYHWKHEPCLYGWKDGASHHFVDDRSQSTVFEDRGLEIHKMKKSELEALLQTLLGERVSTTVLCEDKPVRNAEHPTMKPVKLLARLIRNSSRAGETVLDLFGGSGSTLITCEQLKRRCFTMELDPHYCDVILTRWERLTNRTAKKEDCISL